MITNAFCLAMMSGHINPDTEFRMLPFSVPLSLSAQSTSLTFHLQAGTRVVDANMPAAGVLLQAKPSAIGLDIGIPDTGFIRFAEAQKVAEVVIYIPGLTGNTEDLIVSSMDITIDQYYTLVMGENSPLISLDRG
ncbi:MAG: hypothetical protein LPH21_09675 [Shewanella sp.]|nr:hypothetical protein [Shewanella sp.]